MPPTVSYRLTGNFFELCDCSVVCPCWLGDEPDNGGCTGVFAWSITEGDIDGLDVSGRRVASVSFHTGNRAAGGQEVYLFVDDGAAVKQADLLADAFTGKLGGPLSELAGMLGVLMGSARTRIDIDNGDRETNLVIGNSIAGTAEVLFGTDGQVTELSHSPVSRILTPRAEIAKTGEFRVGLGREGFDLQVDGTAAMRGRFSYHNEGGEPLVHNVQP